LLTISLARCHWSCRGLQIRRPAPVSPLSWAGRARTELSRLGLRPPAPLELTATEERVAALATPGRLGGVSPDPCMGWATAGTPVYQVLGCLLF